MSRWIYNCLRRTKHTKVLRNNNWRKKLFPWFSIFKLLVNTVTYVQWALRKLKSVTKIIGSKEQEKTKLTIFKILQQEQFAEDMNSLKVEKEISKSSKIWQFTPFINRKRFTLRKAERAKSIGFQWKHPILLDWKNHGVDLFLRNNNKQKISWEEFLVTKVSEMFFGSYSGWLAYEKPNSRRRTNVSIAGEAGHKQWL